MRVSNSGEVGQERKIDDSHAKADQRKKEPDNRSNTAPPAQDCSTGLKSETTKEFLDRRYTHFQLFDFAMKTEMFYSEMSSNDAYQS